MAFARADRRTATATTEAENRNRNDSDSDSSNSNDGHILIHTLINIKTTSCPGTYLSRPPC
jgi:hypothetical protein